MTYQVALRAFDPQNQTTVNIAVGAGSANVQVSPSTSVGHRNVRLLNVGTQTVFVQKGKDSTVAATVASSIPIAAGGELYLYLHNDETWIAAIAGSTGSTLYITVGEGK